MEKKFLTEEIFSRLDLIPLSNLLKCGYRLLNQKLELRDPLGKIILSSPESKTPLFPDHSYQELLLNGLSRGEVQRLTIDTNRLMLGVPIMKEDSFMGSLIISETGSPHPSPTNKDGKFYLELADFITKEYTAQLEIMSLSEELASRYEELNLFYDVGKWLKGVQETEKSIQLIIDKISSTMEVDHSFISLPDKDTLAVSGSFKVVDKQRYLNQLGNDLLKAFTNNDFVILDQVHDYQILNSYSPAPFSLIAVPLNMNGLCHGALGAFFMQKAPYKKFTASDIKLLHSMAEVISILLSNTELYHNIKTFLLSVVKCLVSAIEAKDIYTRGHSERVNHISMLIANYMNLPQNDQENLNWASILHDVGKIGIPEKILTKSGKLSDEEFAEIKKHPERGYIILKPIKGFQAALDGVRFHQERYDGRGYPLGLKGKQIPLSARIIAVGDTYDAITSSRAYRKGRSHQEAIAEIKRVAGTQLDPDIVQVFLNLVESKQWLKMEAESQNEN